MIKLLTFDLDNTLWPINEVIRRATKIKFSWLNEHYPIIKERINEQDFVNIRNRLIQNDPLLIADLSAIRLRTIEEAAIQAGIPRNESVILSQKAFDIFFKERNNVQLFPHTHEVLSELSQQFDLIALTNGNSDLNIIGIAQYFSEHIKPVDAGLPKPAPDMFELALKKSNVSASESIHIGDDLVCDIEGAKSLGFKTIFTNILEKHSPESEAMADESVSHLKDLPAAIKKIISSL